VARHQRKVRESPPARDNTPAAPAVDLDGLDLTQLAKLARSFHDQLDHYQRYAVAAGFRVTIAAGGLWPRWLTAAGAVEAELTRLGLGAGPVTTTSGTGLARVVADLRWLLLEMRGWDETGWGVSPTMALPAGKSLPDLSPWLGRLRELTIDLAAVTDPAPAPPPRDGGQGHGETRHGIDFRSVRWYGTDYTFTKNQAAIVKLLWDAWENGTPEVGGDTLLTEADCETKRLDHLFNLGKHGRHPAWGTMIRPGSQKGTYRLAKPTA
jgi:hypothetical protein